MSIKVSCSCGQSFKAKDELAGKRVRCPKCKNPLVIPAAEDPDELRLEAPAEVAKYNPLEDILAEEGVKAAHAGPTCPSCGEPINQQAVICVQCGFNIATGEKISTFVDEEDDEDAALAGMSETDKMIYKAEREIEDMPISADNEKFGDESESFILAIGAIILVALVVGLAVFMIIQLDKIENFDTARVSMWMSLVFVLGAATSVTITAFKERPLQGYLCLSIGYIPIYAAIRGLYVQLGIFCLFAIIAGGCYVSLGE